MRRLVLGLLALSCVAAAATFDRIAIVVQDAIIKDSDIDRNVRVTDFLNGTPVVLNPASRREVAQRMIDQTFIRNEVLTGDYPSATQKQIDTRISELRKHRGDAVFDAELKRDGLIEEDVREVLEWEITVLDFIDARFKPAAFVTEDEVAAYYKEHQSELKRQYPRKTGMDELSAEITNLLQGEKVNKLFFDWLDQQRKNGKIEYREAYLK